MATIPELLSIAIQQHQAGNLQQAGQLYRQILQIDPNQPDALHLFGLLAAQVGRTDLAVAYIGQALRLKPDYAAAHNNLGNVLQRQRRLAEAEACFREALRLRPDFADAQNNLGAVLQEDRRLEEAEACLREALRLKPDYVEAHSNLGAALHKQGRLKEAEVCFREALRLRPDFADAQNNLGAVLQEDRRLEEAEACFREALRLKPDYVEAHSNLGVALQEQGRLKDAEACFRQAVRLTPHSAELHHNLGNLLQEQERLEEAVACWQQALRLKPDYAEAYNDLGLALEEQGRLEEAAACYQQALRCKPDYAAAYYNLGIAFKKQGQLDKAVASYQQALRLKPDYAEAYNNLGRALEAQLKFEEAVASYQQALRLKPDFNEPHHNLGRLLADQGKMEEAIASIQHALRLGPSDRLRIEHAKLLPPIYASAGEVTAWRTTLQEKLTQLHGEQVTQDLTKEPTSPLFRLAYQGLNDRDLQRQLARLYVAPRALAGPRAPGSRNGERRIKVAFVSRHLRQHTIGELFCGFIAHLSRDAFAVTVFSLGRHQDAIAQFLQAHVEAYVELPRDLLTARQRIATHEPDVLVYPDIGMDDLTYSLAFSRLAPVQCVTWGHPVTTGIPTIDYYLSSELFETAEADQHYTETLVRLKGLPCYCYRVQPPRALKARDDFGLPVESHLYACPQSLFKFHPDFDELLGGILRRDPRGIVILNHPHHTFYQHWVELLQQRFSVTLPDVRDRIRFLPYLSHDDYLNLNLVCDVLLDTLHFNGGNTSLKALAFGVPIVTLPSRFLRGRITQAFYQQMHVLDCVAADPAEYIHKAVRLGTEPDYRAHIRAKILEANAVLYENPAGVRAFEEFLRRVQPANEHRWQGGGHGSKP